MSTSEPKLMRTRNYARFDCHENNRKLHKDPVLRQSMEEHGFMPSSPIHCVRNGNSKLKVIRGHHRLMYAKELGLPVYYIIDDTNTNIFELEAGKQLWNVEDYAVAYASTGKKDCALLLAFKKKHGLTMGSAASLVGGQSASSGNMQKEVKRGAFRQGDMKHAEAVVAVTDLLREKGLAFATQSAFVAAVSMVLRVPEVELDVLLAKATAHYEQVHKRGTKLEYLDEIEALYNYGTRFASRLSIKNLAIATGQARQATFGKSNEATKPTGVPNA